MEDLTALYVSRLRERAARCRELARRAKSGGLAREFEAIARDYDEDAERLERRMPSLGAAYPLHFC